MQNMVTNWHQFGNHAKRTSLKGGGLGSSFALLLLLTLIGVETSGFSQDFSFDELPLGNIFDVGQVIRISGTAKGDVIRCELTDGWSTSVDKQFILVSETGRFLYEKGAVPAGFYTLGLSVMKGTRIIVSQSVSLAILPPSPHVSSATSPFGACTHFAFGWPADFLEVLKRAGIMNIRDGLEWSSVEKERGEYVFPGKYTELIHKAGANGIEPLIVAGFGNGIYAPYKGDESRNWAAPYKPEHHEAYARFVVQYLKQFPSEIKTIEIWNEYNGGFCPGPAEGRPEVYAEMYKATWRSIKQIDPSVRVLACSTIGVPVDWIEKAVASIGADKIDGVAVHPYRYSSPPEGLADQLLDLQSMLRRHNNGNPIPIWVTEQGWYAQSKMDKSWGKLSRHKQACYLVRSWLEQLAGGAEKIYWYVGRDYPSFPSMGLVKEETCSEGRYAPHEAFAAYATLIQRLNNTHFVKRDMLSKDIYHCGFKNQDNFVHTLWSTTSSTVQIKASAPARMTDMFGATSILSPVNGLAYVLLEDAPIYLEGAIEEIKPLNDLLCSTPTQCATNEPLPLNVDLSSIGISSYQIKAGDTHEAKATATAVIPLEASPADGELWIPISITSAGGCPVAGFRKIELIKPSTLSNCLLLDDKGLHISVRNASSSRPLVIQNISTIIDDKTYSQGSQNVAIPPSSIKEFVFPLSNIAHYKVFPVDITVTAKDQPEMKEHQKISMSPISPKSITVNGDLEDWQGMPFIPVSTLDYHKIESECDGDDDLGGQVWVCYDARNIYVAAAIVDDYFCQPFHGWDTWKGDNIQLAISPLPPWAAMSGNFLHEFGMSLTPSGPEFYRYAGEGRHCVLPDVTLKIVREGNRTLYECAIPWDTILGMDRNNPSFSFAFLVNDNDGKGRKGYREWGSIKDPRQLQYLRAEVATATKND